MPQARHEEVFPCAPEVFFKIVSDYEKYPEFLKDVKATKVLKREKNRVLVEYTISVVKTFKYQLWMEEHPPRQILWTLAEGDLFKKSEGSWTLESLEGGKKTKAIYSVDVEFKILVPGPIAKALLTVNLPEMMKSYQQRVKSYV